MTVEAIALTKIGTELLPITPRDRCVGMLVDQPGLLSAQPVAVMVLPEFDHPYQAISGHVSLAAAHELALPTATCAILPTSTVDTAARALLQDILQDDVVSPLNKGLALVAYRERFGESIRSLAEKLPGVASRELHGLVELTQLNEGARDLFGPDGQDPELPAAAARRLHSLADSYQTPTALHARTHRWSIRRLEAFIRHLRKLPTGVPFDKALSEFTDQKPSQSGDYQAFADQLTEQLCAPVDIAGSPNEGFTITFRYHSTDELSGLMGRLLGINQAPAVESVAMESQEMTLTFPSSAALNGFLVNVLPEE